MVFVASLAATIAVAVVLMVPKALRGTLRRMIGRKRPITPPTSPGPSVRLSGHPLPVVTEQPDTLAPHDAVHDRDTREAAVRFWHLIMANEFGPIDLDGPAEPPPAPSRSRIPAHNRRRRIHARKIARTVYKYVRS